MTPDVLDALVTAGRAPGILDVRSRREFELGHVPGAEHLPFWQTPWRRPRRAGDPGAPLVVYCGHGPRAWLAGLVLRARGVRHVTYLEGHYARWSRQGRRRARGSPEAD